jgi:hypothetical protein
MFVLFLRSVAASRLTAAGEKSTAHEYEIDKDQMVRGWQKPPPSG